MEFFHKQSITLDLLEDQDNGVSEVIYGGGSGGGKTILGCYWLLKQALRYPNTRWLMGRAELKTLKRTTLMSFYRVVQLQDLNQETLFKYNEMKGEINFYNGSTILLADCAHYPSDEKYDRFGGLEISGAYIDEIAEIRKECWDVIKSRIRYNLSENGLSVKMLGTLNPEKNWVYTFFYKPWKEDTLEPYRRFIQALPTDNKFLEKANLVTLSQMPKIQRDRYYLGIWEVDGDQQMINNSAISDIYTNSFITKSSTKYISADISRLGKDKTIIMLWEGFKVVEIIEKFKLRVDETAQVIKDLATQHRIPMSRVIVDESGVGGGVADILRCVGFTGGSSALRGENYLNLRTQAFYYLAEYINDNKIWIGANIKADTVTMISQELEQIVRLVSDGEGKLRIIPKSEIKSNIGRSPDYSDTLSMRMYFEINPPAVSRIYI